MHGWPDDHTLWRHQVAALSEAGFRTIAPDLRGFGASDKPTDVAAYALKHTVVDMLAVCIRRLDPTARLVSRRSQRTGG